MDSVELCLLRDLTTYAQAEVASGAAADALRIVEADVVDLVAAYGIGLLPLTYRDALPPSARPLLAGRRIAGCLWLPARDECGQIVDGQAIHPRPAGGAYVGWCKEPQGLLGATIATSFPDLIVCDNLRVVARCFRRGLPNTLLLRGVADAIQAGPRLRAAGVRRVDVRVRRNITAYADALRTAGLDVQVSSCALDAGAGYFVNVPAPAPPESAPETDPHARLDEEPAPPSSASPAAPASEPMQVVQHDRRQGRATFRVGGSVYVVEVPADGRTLIDVTLRHGQQVQSDRFDLAVPEARACFAGVAGARCGLPEAVVAGHLVGLLGQVRQLAQADPRPSRPAQLIPGTPDAQVVRSLLSSSALLARIAADLDALGWVGEESAKCLAYLVSISRKLPTPLWCQRIMPPGIAASGIDLIADLTPPEDVVRVSRLTAAMLDRHDPQALCHALLVADDGAAIADDAILALRILQTRGAVGVAQPRPVGSGSTRPAQAPAEARGPIALLTTTTRRLDASLTATCISLPLDDSPAQTERVIATQGRAYADQGQAGAAAATRQAIRARHHALQRAVICRPVVIACADRIVFPAHTVQDRRDHALFLGIVAAHALLHQYQRDSDGDAVVADERDVTAAITLAAVAHIGTERALSSAASDLLTAWWRLGQATELAMSDVLDLRPSWTPYTARGAVAELTEAGHVAIAAGGGQGRRCVFRLVGTAPTPAPSGSRSRIRLAPAGEAPADASQDAAFSCLEKSSKSASRVALCG